MRFASWSALAIGALMLAQWGFFLVTDQVPELETEPLRILFHLAAEGLTAIALIVAGLALRSGRRGAINLALVANGMLIYTTIVSPGYFAQQGEWALVAMFVVPLALAVVSIIKLWSVRPRVNGGGM